MELQLSSQCKPLGQTCPFPCFVLFLNLSGCGATVFPGTPGRRGSFHRLHLGLLSSLLAGFPGPIPFPSRPLSLHPAVPVKFLTHSCCPYPETKTLNLVPRPFMTRPLPALQPYPFSRPVWFCAPA